jgi:hypothetical protein
VKEFHFYIFDDIQHDSLFVQDYFMFQWEHMTLGDQVLPLDIGCGLIGVPPNLSLPDLNILLSISRFDEWVFDELELLQI